MPWHVYVCDGTWAFDFAGWTREDDLLAVTREQSGDIESVLVTSDLTTFCENNDHRRPDQFLGRPPPTCPRVPHALRRARITPRRPRGRECDREVGDRLSALVQVRLPRGSECAEEGAPDGLHDGCLRAEGEALALRAGRSGDREGQPLVDGLDQDLPVGEDDPGLATAGTDQPWSDDQGR